MAGIKDINLGQYAPRDSFIHDLDPRTKIFLCFIIMLLIFFMNSCEFLFVFAVLILFFYKTAKLSLSLAFKNIRPFFLLFVITFLLHGFFTEGKIILQIPFLNLNVSQEGLVKGFFYSIRIIILIIIAGLLTLTTSPMSITDGIEKFLRPFKKYGLPAHEIAMIISIAMRFIPILIDESERIKKAQISRGARFEGSIINKIKSIIPLVIPLFISGLRKAQELSFAMEARAYRGGEGRTSFLSLRFRRNDFMSFCLIFFILIAILWLRFF